MSALLSFYSREKHQLAGALYEKKPLAYDAEVFHLHIFLLADEFVNRVKSI